MDGGFFTVELYQQDQYLLSEINALQPGDKVQVNGKLKGKILVPVDTDKDEALALAKADEKVAYALEGKTVVKEIVIPNKIINIVVK